MFVGWLSILLELVILIVLSFGETPYLLAVFVLGLVIGEDI